MARVPTWTELRLDALKLAKLQRECYRDVHQLLDYRIPELDKKISYLHKNNKKISSINDASNQYHDQIVGGETFERKKHLLPVTPSLQPQLTQKNPPRKSKHSLTSSRSQPVLNVLTEKPSTTEHSINERYPTIKAKKLAIKKKLVPVSEKASLKNGFIELDRQNEPNSIRHKIQDVEELEHLKPLPLRLSEYLKLNRPEVVLRANKRVMYLKIKSQQRRDLAAAKVVNCLRKIRLSPEKNNIKQITRNYSAPEYEVKNNFSEHEMKRLTARVYEKLPEVKRRRTEEVRNHMKVQNYKNRLEYGRKLLENRRLGIINYPLN